MILQSAATIIILMVFTISTLLFFKSHIESDEGKRAWVILFLSSIYVIILTFFVTLGLLVWLPHHAL